MRQRILLCITGLFFLISTQLLLGHLDIASDNIFYTVFDDYHYYLNAILPDGFDQRFIAEIDNGWFQPSPDASRIAFLQRRSGTLMEGQYDIVLGDSAGNLVRRLTTENYNHFPVWSPLENEIAFLSGQRGDRFDVYLINLDGIDFTSSDPPAARRLTDLQQLIHNLSWSPDGQELAFDVCDENFNCDLYVMDRNGTSLQNVTDKFVFSTDVFTWSPDSKQIAFVAYSANDEVASIYLLNLETDTINQLTDTYADYTHLNWSPDGRFLAYVSDLDRGWDIYRVNAEGSDRVKLTNDNQLQEGFYGLDWSPAGNKIVFTSGPIEGDFELFVMDVDGTNVIQLTNNEFHEVNPIWSS
jgi:dipeptidyl aminopeptidase/acylaminoacyl peptidase